MLNLIEDVQHHGNALHLYSRLCRYMNATRARRIARRYEKLFNPLLYRGCSLKRK